MLKFNLFEGCVAMKGHQQQVFNQMTAQGVQALKVMTAWRVQAIKVMLAKVSGLKVMLAQGSRLSR